MKQYSLAENIYRESAEFKERFNNTYQRNISPKFKLNHVNRHTSPKKTIGEDI